MKNVLRKLLYNKLYLATSAIFSFCIGLIALKFIMPDVIEHIYEGKKLWIINKDLYALEHYLHKWNKLSNVCLSVWALINVGIFTYFYPATKVLYSRLARLNTSYIVVFCWLVLVAVSVIGKEAQGEKFLISLAFLLIFLFFVNIRSVRALFAPVSLGKKTILLGIFSIMAYVQITREWFYLYPFVHFSMFCNPITSKEVVFYEYQAETATQETIPLNPTEVIPALRQRRIEGVLRDLEEKTTLAGTPKDSADAKSKYISTIQAIGKLYNKKNPDRRIVGIKVIKCSFNIDDYSDKNSIKRENIWNIGLEPEKKMTLHVEDTSSLANR